MRKLLSTAAAVLMAGSIAGAANIPLLTGPWDSGNVQGTINLLINAVNFGTAGLLGYVNGPVGSSALTTPQFFTQTTVLTGQLQTGGQSLRVTCSGEAAASAAQKNIFISVANAALVTGGTSTAYTAANVASAAFGGATATAWTMQVNYHVGNTVATLGTAATPNSFDGWASVPGSTTTNFVWASPDTTNNIATGLTIQCGYETISKADVTMQSFLVEQVK
jgi:hypothetical protein